MIRPHGCFKHQCETIVVIHDITVGPHLRSHFGSYLCLELLNVTLAKMSQEEFFSPPPPGLPDFKESDDECFADLPPAVALARQVGHEGRRRGVPDSGEFRCWLVAASAKSSASSSSSLEYVPPVRSNRRVVGLAHCKWEYKPSVPGAAPIEAGGPDAGSLSLDAVFGTVQYMFGSLVHARRCGVAGGFRG